jgi:rod shape-determining protein MreD
MTGESRRAAVSSTVVTALLLVHFLFRPFFVAAPVAPNLLLGGLLLATLRLSAGRGALLGFLLGVLEGAMAMEGMGETALVLALIGYLAARSRDLLFADARYFTLGYLFAGTWLAEIGIQLFVGGDFDPVQILLVVPADALLTALVVGLAEAALVARWR